MSSSTSVMATVLRESKRSPNHSTSITTPLLESRLNYGLHYGLSLESSYSDRKKEEMEEKDLASDYSYKPLASNLEEKPSLSCCEEWEEYYRYSMTPFKKWWDWSESLWITKFGLAYSSFISKNATILDTRNIYVSHRVADLGCKVSLCLTGTVYFPVAVAGASCCLFNKKLSSCADKCRGKSDVHDQQTSSPPRMEMN